MCVSLDIIGNQDFYFFHMDTLSFDDSVISIGWRVWNTRCYNGISVGWRDGFLQMQIKSLYVVVMR